MSNTYYSSLSGMLAASYGLQNTSNNVANMQSQGFKRSDVFYSSLGSNGQNNDAGQGVRVSGSATDFSQGKKYTPTGKRTDLAIIGNEFFVIRLKTNELIYTRNGAFEFKNGVLTDPKTNGQVLGYDRMGHLAPIYEKGPKETPAKGTRKLSIEGAFTTRKIPASSSNNTPDIPPINPKEKPKVYENVTFTLDNIYDDQGTKHQLKFEFEHNKDLPTSDEWRLVQITENNEEIYYYSPFQQINFTGDYLSYTNTINFSLNKQQDISLYFGNYNDNYNNQVKLDIKESHESYESSIKIYDNDGYGIGKQYDYHFDEDGLLTYLYDNGQEVKGAYIGLARFDDMEHNLIQDQHNFFRAKTPHGIHYGRPNHQGYQTIRIGELEGSNVDSTEEFANIVVLQRMFQACSQIMDIDKQLIEELEGRS